MLRNLYFIIIRGLAKSNRPLRIFIFGGALIAYGILKLLGYILDVQVNDNDISFLGAILIAVSIFVGYLASYGAMRFIELSASSEEN